MLRKKHHASVLSNEEFARLRLLRSERIGPRTFRDLLKIYGSGERAVEAAPELAKRNGAKLELAPVERITRELDALEKAGATLLFENDSLYPIWLRSIEDAPPVLSCKGDKKWLANQAIAIVGARNASLNGQRFTEKLAKDLGEKKYVIASGLARGIDTAAHRGALATGTVAVVAGGLDVIYPKENEKLYEAIAERGLIVSEMPMGAVPKAEHFPRRNRIISGLSLGVVVVEAAVRSGSLITARYALAQGREVFAVPGSPLDPRAEGPNKLLKQGANLIEGAADIEDALAFHQQHNMHQAWEEPASPFIEAVPLPEENELEVLRAELKKLLSTAPVNVDDLAENLHAPVRYVQILLLEMELAELIERHPGNKVALVY